MTLSTIRRGRRKLLSLTGIASLALLMSGCTFTGGFIGVQGNSSNALTGIPLGLSNGSVNLELLCSATIHKASGNCIGRNVGSIGNQPFATVAAVGGALTSAAGLTLPPGAHAGMVIGAARYGTDPATGKLVSQPNALFLDISFEAGQRSPRNTSLIAVIPVPLFVVNKATSELTANDVSSTSAALSFIQRQTGKNFSTWSTFLQQHPYLTGVTQITVLPFPVSGAVIAGFQCSSCATIVPTGGGTISVGP